MSYDTNIWEEIGSHMKTAPYNIHNTTLFILIVLSSIYTLFLLISSVFINKLVMVFNHVTTMSAFFFPLTVIISDIESFFHSLKKELGYTERYMARE